MSRGIWNLVVCVLMITNSTIAMPLEFDVDEISEFDITDSETGVTSPEIDDTIDIFSIGEELDGTEETLPQCDSDCEVELTAEELKVNDFNSDFTSQEDFPTEIVNAEVIDWNSDLTSQEDVPTETVNAEHLQVNDLNLDLTSQDEVSTKTVNSEELQINDFNSNLTSQEDVPTETVNADEINVNDFNSDLTSQKDLPTITKNEVIKEPAEIKQKEITSEQKSKNNEILAKIETALLKSRSDDGNCNDIVMPVPEFVPIFKPRGGGVVIKNIDSKKNCKAQPTAPASVCPNSVSPTVNEDNKFVITGLYLKPLTDLNPNAINTITKGPTQSTIPSGYPAEANSKTRIVNGNVNLDVSCGYPSLNQIFVNKNIPEIQNSNLGIINLGIPPQKQIEALNPNQGIMNKQRVLYNAAPCPPTRVLNTQNQMSLQNANLRTSDTVPTNPNVLLNSNSPYNQILNIVIPNKANACPANLKTGNADLSSANNIPCFNLNLNAGKQIQNQLITSNNLATGKLLASNSLATVRNNKPLFLFKPETFTRHEICGDLLKKKTYTVLVPYQISNIA